VLSANLHRRHLTTEQKRKLIAKEIANDPSKSDRAIAKAVKADKNTVATMRSEMEGRGEIHHVETRTDTKGRQQPAKRQHTYKPPTESQKAAAKLGMKLVMGGITAASAPASPAEQEQMQQVKIQNIGLQSEIEELRAAAVDIEAVRAQYVRLLQQRSKPEQIEEIKRLIDELGLPLVDFDSIIEATTTQH
jgi:hypothetical protein